MVAIVNEMPRSTIVGETENYLHVEFRSRIFRFVDDVEFFFDEADSLVQFRSAVAHRLLGHGCQPQAHGGDPDKDGAIGR